MTFETLVISLVAIVAGAAFAFGGYRLFLVLLPIWAFFVGFIIGGDAIHALFGDGFLSTVIGWVVGLVVALAFAALSYFLWWFAVGLVGGSLGWTLATGVLAAIGIGPGVLQFIIALAVGIAVAYAFFALAIPKYVVIVATALNGAAAVAGGLALLFGVVNTADFGNGLLSPLADKPFWLVIWLLIGAGGIVSQIATTSALELSLRELSESRSPA
jgi:hypothetical protein